jgi:flavodoxin
MKLLVVYYSNRGSTAKIAKAITTVTNASGRELIDSNSQTGKGMMTLALSAMLGWSSSLRNPDYNLEGFDTILLMTPIWAGNPTPAMNTFLKKVNLRGKQVILALVGAGTDNMSAADKLTKSIEASSGKVSEIIYLQGASLAKDAKSLTDTQVNVEAEKVISKRLT